MAQHDNTVDDLEDVVDIVGDENTGVPRIAGIAHETQHALCLGDTEVVGRFVEDDQFAVKMHCTGDGDRLPLAAR